MYNNIPNKHNIDKELQMFIYSVKSILRYQYITLNIAKE